MKVEKPGINGLLVIQPNVFYDDRGFFFESFHLEKMKQMGMDASFVQDNLSKSAKGVLRGLHFQRPPYAQAKLVQVLKGAVLDVVVDIRSNSPTYGQHFAIELNEDNKTIFYIPEGFAHGFVTLEEDTIFSYKCSNLYNKDSEGSIVWNDEQLGINWKTENPIISDKDNQAASFSELQTPF